MCRTVHTTISSLPARHSAVKLDPIAPGTSDKVAGCDQFSAFGNNPSSARLAVKRKVRFSKQSWRELNEIARIWSRGGTLVSPSQVATSILDLTIHAFKEERDRKRAKECA
ncbi:MAG: hypothetical protein HY897_16780 [Deltaproteobacteria bacterium]|nr:hypothetical protein [Deltaproteobacteria bacterium]